MRQVLDPTLGVAFQVRRFRVRAMRVWGMRWGKDWTRLVPL
jgi:hypothetical protein